MIEEWLVWRVTEYRMVTEVVRVSSMQEEEFGSWLGRVWFCVRYTYLTCGSPVGKVRYVP